MVPRSPFPEGAARKYRRHIWISAGRRRYNERIISAPGIISYGAVPRHCDLSHAGTQIFQREIYVLCKRLPCRPANQICLKTDQLCQTTFRWFFCYGVHVIISTQHKNYVIIGQTVRHRERRQEINYVRGFCIYSVCSIYDQSHRSNLIVFPN